MMQDDAFAHSKAVAVRNAADRSQGDRRAAGVDELYSLAYEELKRLASVVRYREQLVSMNTTGLVHEAWLKLSTATTLTFESDAHFRHVVVRAMRQVLVDSARRRHAFKRDGIHVDVDASIPSSPPMEDRILEIDAALTRLSALNPRQAEMVEARFFGGLDVAETARMLGVSEATVHRDWRLARAWLSLELSDG